MRSGAIRVQGLSGLAANFRAFDQDVQRRVRGVVKARGTAQHAQTVAECPKRTGYMASKTRLDFSPAGLAYSIGYDPADFPGDFYPPYVLFGTSRTPSNNVLLRVHEQHAPQFTRDVGAAVRVAANNAG